MRKLLRVFIAFFLLFMWMPTTYSGPQQAKDVYKIQVASYAKQVSIERVQGDTGLDQTITMHIIGGRYKFFVGHYDTWAAANADVARVPVQGAYVVKIPAQLIDTQQQPARQEEERVAETTQPPVETETTTRPAAGQDEMTYRIQVAASRTFIRPEYFHDKLGLTEDVDYFRKD